jgi:hypothetical protein
MADELVTRVVLDDAQALAEWRKLQEEARNFAATIRTQVNMSFSEFANTLSKAAAGGDDLFKSMMRGANEMRASVNAAKTDLLELIAQTRAAETASIRIGSFGAAGGGAMPGTLPAQQHLLRGSVLDPDFVREQAQDVEREVDAFFAHINSKTAAALPRGQRPAFFALPEMMGDAQMGVPRSVTDVLAASQMQRPQRPEYFELPEARREMLGPAMLERYRPREANFLDERAMAGIQQARQQFDGMQGSTKRGTMAILELSRAAEDFSVSAQTGGFAMGLRSAINNMAQFAFIIHPMAGVVAGFAGAIAAVMLPKLYDGAMGVESVGDKYKDLQVTLEDVARIRAGTPANSIEGLQQELDLQQKFGFEAGSKIATPNATNKFVSSWAGLIGGDETDKKLRLLQRTGQQLSQEERDYIQKTMQEMAGTTTSAVPRIQQFLEKNRTLDVPGPNITVPLDEAFIKELHEEDRRLKLNTEKLNAAIKKRTEDLIAVNSQKTLDIEMQAAQEEIALATQLADRRKSLSKELEREVDSLSEMGGEEKKYKDAMRKAQEEIDKYTKEGINAPGVTNPLEAMVGIYSDAQGQAKERRERLEEITAREEELRDRPQSLEGTIVGLQEMGRRIQEAAGKPEDSTKEELKRLRDERKKIADLEKEQRREMAETLRKIAENTANPPVGVAG